MSRPTTRYSVMFCCVGINRISVGVSSGAGGKVGFRVGVLGFMVVIPLMGFFGLTVVFWSGPKYRNGWISVVIWVVLCICFGLRVVFFAGFPFVFGFKVVFRSTFGVVVIFGFWVVLPFVGLSVEFSVGSVWASIITRVVSRVVFSVGILVVTLAFCALCTQMKSNEIDTNRK